jgi:integration host factor subunit beta
MANKKQKKIVKLPREVRLEVRKGLMQYGKVKIVGLGIFETREIPSRRGRNPKNGEIVMIPSYWKIKFRPTKALKEAIC